MRSRVARGPAPRPRSGVIRHVGSASGIRLRRRDSITLETPVQEPFPIFWRVASYSVGCFIGVGIGHFVPDPELGFVGLFGRVLLGLGAYGPGLLVIWKWSASTPRME